MAGFEDERRSPAKPEEHEADRIPASVNYRQFKEIVTQKRHSSERPRELWGSRLKALDGNLYHFNLPRLFMFTDSPQYEVDEASLREQVPKDISSHDAWVRREIAEETAFADQLLLIDGVEAYLALSHRRRYELGGEGANFVNEESAATKVLRDVVAVYRQAESEHHREADGQLIMDV